MSDTTPFGFGRFVPGFDFLQNLAKGAAAGMPAMPAALSGWVAPTMSVEELDKRIQELKAVQFWLEQNARALTATVQALEVQKMTLATLQGMNVAMGDMVGAFGTARPAADAKAQAWAGMSPAPGPTSAPTPQPEPVATPEAHADAATGSEQAKAESKAPGTVDPMQWWGALTNQFQQLAANAMKDAGAHHAAFEATREMASGALKTATDMAAQMAAQGMQGAAAAAKAAADAPTPTPTAAKRPAARKTAGVAKKAAAPRTPR
ncbi:PhaM family polyhydroxyalkanoate granule multifunctional regulatory protein [Alicycliphilus denitrificans]|uniref:PhaM family polyhydroxyalkanoate granule multifunctional regulatory protein n=1 Tax=Alicycliphilus denitrificans TaxID=179636 RepID=UPI00384B4C45